MSFGMWGEPVDRAIELSEQGEPGVLVDTSVADLLGDDVAVTPVDDRAVGDAVRIDLSRAEFEVSSDQSDP